MRPEEIRALRAELGCSVGELAHAVGVEPRMLLAWEAGDLFPTKRHVGKLVAARKAGPAALRTRKAEPGRAGTEVLEDPRLWAIVKRLVTDPTFFAEVEKLAKKA
jgi:transcriptional regulator with XRE-family HTH domain